MRQGVRLGVDVGRVRVGVARSDRDGLLATPVETIQRSELGALVARIRSLVDELDAIEVVVGLPLSLSGVDTPSTKDARDVADALAAVVPVRLVDERLSTVTAQAGMRQAGRSTRRQKDVIDQAAAVVILQHALDAERSGRAPGMMVDHEED
ncbi:Holliday junction resolvase RuvX [Agrococcus sp. SGAir0287]|uniref:Holliday junction resolvase RuvX n=1 Tax=Agrococcus sp. SGAir0287 TaxID=2070347 RepID=UPI0010CD27E7|nr:Holliday junction resolvase RuvX [Agrococcus sp. SGAir0287]QCR19324.1 Holliday junction resolvase RuvX [Agrococcus sp. SGAir0287]